MKKQAVFICQISENLLKAVKFLPGKGLNKDGLAAITSVALNPADDKDLKEKMFFAYRELKFNEGKVVLSISRNFVTSRYIKVPAQSPQEIEKIATLQASRSLPYSAEELITGYQVVSTDKKGFSCLNTVVVHKDLIMRYIRFFDELKVGRFNIFLNSYGLINLYNRLMPKDPGAVMLVDVDYNNVELVVVINNKLAFSRYFKVNRLTEGWQEQFSEEINKSRDAYLKEVGGDLPQRTFILGEKKSSLEIKDALGEAMAHTVEILPYEKRINAPADVSKSILGSAHSFAGLIGLGLEGTIEDSLNLMPFYLKEKSRNTLRHRELFKIAVFVLAIVLSFFLGTEKNLANKAEYLKRLKGELDKVAKEAGPLEDIERAILIYQNRKSNESLILGLFHEVYEFLPQQAFLNSLSYEEGAITLRGQASELNSVVSFVSQLEKSKAFKDFGLKITYATKRKADANEFIDFEIEGAMKK